MQTNGKDPHDGVRGPDSRNSRISLSDEEAVQQVLVDCVRGLWDVVNNLTRLQPSRRERYRVTIFGSPHDRPGTPPYEQIRKTAAALAELGCDIITGGGPGLIKAANEGAALWPERIQSTRIRVDLPFEQEASAFVTDAFENRTFFSRLDQFVLASDAFIVTPGGLGTILETFMIWQLLQVRHVRHTPFILIGKMWTGLIDWVRNAVLACEPPLATPDDLAIPECVADAGQAIALIRAYHSSWLRQGNE
jgi:predicted Rossmann-fold nucleotide-binding protein